MAADRPKRKTWQTILIVGAVALVVGMLTSGYVIWGIAILFVVLALGGGAMLYRKLGPPPR
ncbi:hypothetical protein BH24GEM3_BH24GEM3_07900 [soil metagenome]|jgi:hypothetical protein